MFLDIHLNTQNIWLRCSKNLHFVVLLVFWLEYVEELCCVLFYLKAHLLLTEILVSFINQMDNEQLLTISRYFQ